jgi:Protein of unknown function (DUF998)
MDILAILSIASGILSLFCLVILHFLSPEIQPSWRMISEYALGKHKGWLTLFFFLWGLSTVLVAVLLWGKIIGIWAKLGVGLVFVSGIGAIMGGLFDIKHKWHGLAFGLGVPTFTIGTLLVGYHLAGLEYWASYGTIILLSSHAVWISFVLMGATMALMFSGFKKAGITFGPDAEPPTEVPPGVIALGGYANRFLVLCYIEWAVLISTIYLSIDLL